MSSIIDHFLFYSPYKQNNTIILEKDETKHAISVLRIQNGDSITITDGLGTIYCCSVEEIEPSRCITKIISTQKQNLPQPLLNFFIGIPEKESFELLLQTLVPLGIANIIPVESRYCQKKWWSRKWNKHRERFQKKMIAATKQSWNAFIPLLSMPLSFDSALKKATGTLVVADQKGNSFDSEKKKLSPVHTISCFIGPPGGFSSQEHDSFETSKAISIKISHHRLRTELAATIMAGNLIQLQV